MVSVIMVTYGHEKYIEEAINGVFMQKTNFPVELIIANDCSPDQTDEVVKKLLHNSPKHITVRYTKHVVNKGMNANFIWATKQVKGKYIALCEGDDYWTDPLKLQKQVDFLETYEDYVLVCSNYTSTINEEVVVDIDRDITPFELLHHNPIGTLTALFKSNMLDQLETSAATALGDYLLWTTIAKRGKIRKLGDYTGFYRILQSSASGRDNVSKKIRFLKDVITITVDNVHSFDLSKAEMKEVLFERYSYLINAVPTSAKNEKVKYFREYLGHCKSFTIRDLKYLVSIITT